MFNDCVRASDGLTQVSCVFVLVQEDAIVNVLKLNWEQQLYIRMINTSTSTLYPPFIR